MPQIKMDDYSSTTIFLLLIFSFIATAASSDQQDFLDGHNRARAEVGVPPLTWSNTVANYALDYAHKRYGDCRLEHSKGPYGENLAGGSGRLSAVDAVGLWTGEKSNYNHASNSCQGGQCLHYTQVVWRRSTRLGCARTQCANGGFFVICSYDPPGNYIGQSPY